MNPYRKSGAFDLSSDNEKPVLPEQGIFTVSSLTQMIKNNLESSFSHVQVDGEVSNAKLSSAGHLYFSLKDREALIQAVMFRFQMNSLDFAVTDGMKVRVTGSVSVYAPRGQYQLLVSTLRKQGVGDILAMLEERKQRLAREGLFDNDKKKPLPRLPRKIAVITSQQGAALHDILTVLKRRNSGIDVVILPASVQGEDAPPVLVKRLRQANRFNLADVIIIGRGGGSLEDLLAFSDESVVRAIAESRIPVVSAVGHEVDWSLADFAADVRAPTPSAAAEMVSENKDAIASQIEQFHDELAASIESKLNYARLSIKSFSPADIEARFSRIFMPLARRLDDSIDIITQTLQDRISSALHALALLESDLQSSNPLAILEKGYAVVQRKDPGSGRLEKAPIIDAKDLAANDLLAITFASGMADAAVKEIYTYEKL